MKARICVCAAALLQHRAVNARFAGDAVELHPTANIGIGEYLLFDIGFAIGTVALVLILLQATISHTRQLYREETK